MCRPLCIVLILWITVCRGDEQRPLMRDFIGINGHTVQFKPELYRSVCGVARDYHPVAWDLAKETAVPAPFPLAKNRVDWSQVYGSWRKKDWNIDACLMFESIERKLWTDIGADAKAYGKAFAKEFGPSGTRKLVDSVEIGNEPGKWSDEDYSMIFQAMAEGIREGDPKLKIATCNLTTGKSGSYEKSVACVENFSALFDALNVHTYAQLVGWPTWKRSFPEDPKLTNYLADIDTLCKWRDAHTPGKPVWITEFGYDCTTKPPEKTGDFVKWTGVNDTQQAQWLVRSLLVFSSMPVARAYIYFFDDNDTPHLHGSSGITRHFQPKPSYHALAHLQKVLGEYRFRRIVTNEPGKLRVQEYQNGQNPKKIIWAVWSPTGENKTFDYSPVAAPGRLVSIEQMPLAEEDTRPEEKPARINPPPIAVSESPTYLYFETP